MKKVIIFTVALSVFCGLNIWSQPESPREGSAEQLKNDLLINSIIPGFWQVKQGDTALGVTCMLSLPLNIAAVWLLTDFYLPYFEGNPEFNTEVEGSNYVYYSDEMWTDPERWKLYTAIMASAAAGLLQSYSSYAAVSDLSTALRPGYAEKYGETLEFSEVLAAPWSPENVFNYDVFPAFPMFVLLQMTPDNFTDIGDFFKRDSVPFLGLDIHPAVGAVMALGSSLLLANMSTVSEEMVFRGHLLRDSGIHVSSLIFGPLHLTNAAMPNTSIGETVLQSMFATLFGYYAAYQTEQNGWDFRRMIALHFWHNVTAMTLDYLIDPERTMCFSIGAEIVY